MAFASLPLDGARFSDRFQLALQPCNAFLDSPAINFQLRFPWAACADAARLTRQVMPHPSESRQKVLQLCQLDLQPAFPATGALRKNFEVDCADTTSAGARRK